MPGIYLQPFMVLGSPGTAAEPEIFAPEPLKKANATTTPEPSYVIVFGAGSQQFLKKTLSSVPVTTHAEMLRDYRELSEALADISQYSDEEIDSGVLDIAEHVAAELIAHQHPMPKVFSHGPKSVVFNWSMGKDNLYLTISADRYSALISSPERIQRRVDFVSNGLASPLHLLAAVRAAQANGQAIISTDSTTSSHEHVLLG